MRETNLATGEEREIIGCYFQVMPRLMEHAVKAGNRPAEELSAMREQVVNTIATHMATPIQEVLGYAK